MPGLVSRQRRWFRLAAVLLLVLSAAGPAAPAAASNAVAQTAPAAGDTVPPTAPAPSNTVPPTAPAAGDTVPPTAPAPSNTVLPSAPEPSNTAPPTAPEPSDGAGPAAPSPADSQSSTGTLTPAVAAPPVKLNPLASRISATDPLNGGFLIVNMHGMLFHPLDDDVQEDVAYARWLGGGVIRVFATDNNGFLQWDGTRVGTRIAELAPTLRASHEQLIVALVNNHRAVPGEAPEAAGWMDNYLQLLLPFYTTTWRGAYLQFVRDLVRTVQARQAQDVIYAWELGNELHTPRDPSALIPFITQATQELRALDSVTPILPGTMGANHVEPGNPQSSVARWLYCEAPIDAYTLHAYDWVSVDRQGDMPIEWDLDNVLKDPCPNGRRLPVIVEELGTSRALDGVYTSVDELSRLAQELHQIELVRRYPQVVGFGIWNGESPRLIDKTFLDSRRGMTSYGLQARGGGSCYDPTPDPTPGVRCQLEQALRQLRFVRLGTPAQWAPGPDALAQTPIVGQIDPVASGDTVATLPLSGWVADPSADDVAAGVDLINVILGAPGQSGQVLAQAHVGVNRPDLKATPDEPGLADAGFALKIPLDSVPAGLQTFTLEARTADHGTWLTTLQVVVPTLGQVAAQRPISINSPPAAPVPAVTFPRLDLHWPNPGATVNRSLIIEGSAAPNVDAIEIFIEPDRDSGGRMVGATKPDQLTDTSFRATVDVAPGPHTLYIHAHSATTGKETVVIVPIIAK